MTGRGFVAFWVVTVCAWVALFVWARHDPSAARGLLDAVHGR